MTQDEYNEEVSTGTVLVDFWASWCAPCATLGPIVEELSAEHRIKLVKVNVDEDQDLAVEVGIRSIPTLILYEDGQKSITVVGSHSKERLLRKLQL